MYPLEKMARLGYSPYDPNEDAEGMGLPNPFKMFCTRLTAKDTAVFVPIYLYKIIFKISSLRDDEENKLDS